jgi:8-oxo-dGTP pyrophosphatase MutT (NUDIX family)
MIAFFRQAWAGVTGPIRGTEVRQQVAALCLREGAPGREVLLITSRDTGRWILPKGWPIEGLDGAQSALQEAWEEAGVREADVESEPLGFYHYDKGLSDGSAIPVKCDVYLVRSAALSDEFPERGQRERDWCGLELAATRVREPELQALLRSLVRPANA